MTYQTMLHINSPLNVSDNKENLSVGTLLYQRWCFYTPLTHGFYIPKYPKFESYRKR